MKNASRTSPHKQISPISTLLLLLSLVASISAQVTTTSNRLEAPALYERTSPSVVVITVADARGEMSHGSGIILRQDGVIATNLHVLDQAVSARVQLANGDIYDDVSVLDTDERRDIAILKIKATNLPSLAVANSDTVKIGATVYVIGAPRGLSGSLSSGLVSALRSASEISEELSGFRIIQFTAPVSVGSSGGPLMDDSGRLIGIVFAHRTGGQNLNLAIPANYVVPLVANAKAEGRALKRMPNVAQSGEKTSNKNQIVGTYTGTWESDRYANASGHVVLTITIVNDRFQAHVALTGSDLFKQDTLNASFTPISDGVWRMDYKSKNGKIQGTGFFRGNVFVGDYDFRKFLWTDNGKWHLQK